MSKIIRKFINAVKHRTKEPVVLKNNMLNMLSNIFHTKHDKRALVSFITYPYKIITPSPRHTQIYECISICEILNKLAYMVDIIDYNNHDDLPTALDYQLVIGFGEPIEKILRKIVKKNFLLIAYRNGSDNVFSDKVSLDRMHNFYLKTGYILSNSVIVNPEAWRMQIKFADSIIVLGNEVTLQTFESHYTGKINTLDLFYNDVHCIDLKQKNFAEAGKNFLWFGSRGAVHKGLDLLLEFFSTQPTLHLYIAGLSITESDFCEYYKDILSLPNIHNLGFVMLDTEAFKTIMYTCAAVVCPSVSEGQNGAVLNVLAAGGLIPIVTPNVGINLGEMAVWIEGYTVEDIAVAINKFLKKTDEECLQQATTLLKVIREKHSLENFKINLKNLIVEAIQNHESAHSH